MKRKAKYDYAFKLECAKIVFEKYYSCEAFSKQKAFLSKTFVNGLVFIKNMFVVRKKSKLYY
jgi:hypothetical protein